MSLTIGQIAAVSYPAVLAEKRKPANQWAESAFMRELERQGGIKRESLGTTIEAPLDYQRNPGTVIQSTDLQPLSLAKTEVITSASYAIAQVSVPVTWSKLDEVQNPTRNQKVALVRSLFENAIESHDDILEQQIFATNTNGFLGLANIIPTTGTAGVTGGIDAGANLFWRNPSNTYVDDTDILSGMTTTWNQAAKGSGAKMIPTLIVSDSTGQGTFEGTQQPFQRWGDADEANAGFKVLKFKSSNFVFSQYATTSFLYFMNPRNAYLVVSKEYFRDRGETQELPNAQGFRCLIYSACQFVTNNRSRLGLLHV